jgi:hypothetical protein
MFFYFKLIFLKYFDILILNYFFKIKNNILIYFSTINTFKNTKQQVIRSRATLTTSDLFVWMLIL